MWTGFIFDVEGTLVDSVPQNLRSLDEALKTAIGTTLGWRVEIPQMNETVQVLG